MDSYIEVSFKPVSSEEADILIALLADAGFNGFEENENELKAFVTKSDYDVTVIDALLKNKTFSFLATEVENKNWNKIWETNFEPVIIDDYAAVRAHFHKPVKTVRHEIIITPKMSFGTGHHATTSMMMQEMRQINFSGKTVFDFGTGTGILAILAFKSGAKKVTAIDNDEWSINNATENFQKNNVTGIDLKLSESVPQEEAFDIILANITKNIIIENFSRLHQQLNKNGTLLLSGLLKDDEHEILFEGRKHSLHVNNVRQQGNWLCMQFLR